MPDYRRMYTKLFNKITDVIEALQTAQRETEEMYIQSADPALVVLRPEPEGQTEPVNQAED